MFVVVSLASCGEDMGVMEATHIPVSASSPGWSEMPHDVAVELGGSVIIRCHTLLLYSRIYWMHNGKTVVVPSSKFAFSDSNRTLTYGPVESGDEALIGCVVDTPFGLLPSEVGKITIKCKYIIN